MGYTVYHRNTSNSKVSQDMATKKEKYNDKTLAKFASHLRKIREKKGFTQVELSLESKLERKAVHLIENEKNMPSISTAEKIIKTLGLTMSEFFEEIE